MEKRVDYLLQKVLDYDLGQLGKVLFLKRGGVVEERVEYRVLGHLGERLQKEFFLQMRRGLDSLKRKCRFWFVVNKEKKEVCIFFVLNLNQEF